MLLIGAKEILYDARSALRRAKQMIPVEEANRISFTERERANFSQDNINPEGA